MEYQNNSLNMMLVINFIVLSDRGGITQLLHDELLWLTSGIMWCSSWWSWCNDVWKVVHLSTSPITMVPLSSQTQISSADWNLLYVSWH